MWNWQRRKKPRPKPKRRFPPEVLTDDEVRQLMVACGEKLMTGVRNQALLAVLYRAGLRINEALTLWPKDIDLAMGAIRVLNGKGGKTRLVGIDAGAFAMIERWLDVRQRWGVNGSHPAFCTYVDDGIAVEVGGTRRGAVAPSVDDRQHVVDVHDAIASDVAGVFARGAHKHGDLPVFSGAPFWHDACCRRSACGCIARWAP